MTDDLLLKRIMDICASITVVSLPKKFYNEIPIDWQMNHIVEIEPVCVTTPLFRSFQCNGMNSFELFTFYNWLYSGIRIVPNESRLRFEQFKAIGLALPEAYKGIQHTIQCIYQYQLMPNATSPDSPFGILQLDSDKRIGGATSTAYLIPDINGYGWLNDDTSIHIPSIQKAVAYTDEFCELVSIPSGACGQIIRRFTNPFRITDLQLMMLLSRNADSMHMYSQWKEKAEAIAGMSSELAGFNSNYCDYIAYMSKMIGRIAASLIRHRIWHRLLTDHCQNITLAGELTEFTYATKIPTHGLTLSVNTPGFGTSSFDIHNVESRLYCQVLLLANHVRHFVDCMRWIGVDMNNEDCIFSFVQGMKDTLPEQNIKTLLYNFETNPYCADINLSVQSRLSAENLKNCDDFIKILHKIIHEELG